MYCYQSRTMTQNGDARANWQVECVNNSATATVIPIYSDNISTPIVGVSGIANRAKTEVLTGNFKFFVPDGTYSVKYYDAAGVFKYIEPNVPMFGADSIAALTVDISSEANVQAMQATRAKGKYIVPEVIPCLFRNGSVVWSATTAITAQFILADDRVYWLEKTGTSGATAPTSRAGYIIDSTLFLSFMGERLAVAFAISTAMVLGQRFYANGNEYKVTVAGTTSGAGTGPSTAAGGTDGTVTFIYLGPQTKPILTCTGTTLAGTTQQAAWNSANVKIMGGVLQQNGANARGQVRSVSSDGTNLSAGGGKIAYRCDGPAVSFAYVASFLGNVWVEGELVGIVHDTTGGTSFINLDFSALPRKMRDIVFEITDATQFAGVNATAFDQVAIYVPDNPVKAVLMGDSFAEFSYLPTRYSNRLGPLLGIEDFRIASLGGTGLVQTSGASVNYQTRFNADVLVHAPNFVFIQMTQNDAGGIPGSWSVATVTAALNTLITQARAASIIPVVIGVWNNRGTPDATRVSINTEAQALCATLGVAFINWIDFLTDGGFVGSPTGSGNSLYYTEKDGVHPSFAGAKYRAFRLAPMINAAIAAL